MLMSGFKDSDSASYPAGAQCGVTEQISAQSEVSCLLCGSYIL